MTARSCGVSDIRPKLRPEKRPDRDRRNIKQRIVAQIGIARRVTINFKAGLDLIDQLQHKTDEKKLTDRLGESDMVHWLFEGKRTMLNYNRAG